jgi:hypothetical protein
LVSFGGWVGLLGAEQELADLADRCARELVDDVEGPGALGGSEMVAAPLVEVVDQAGRC